MEVSKVCIYNLQPTTSNPVFHWLSKVKAVPQSLGFLSLVPLTKETGYFSEISFFFGFEICYPQDFFLLVSIAARKDMFTEELSEKMYFLWPFQPYFFCLRQSQATSNIHTEAAALVSYIGSLRCHYCDGDENIKKQLAELSKTVQLYMCITLF